jgi:hypothetical protein
MRRIVAGKVIFLAVLAMVSGVVDQAKAQPFLFSANPNDVTVTQIDLATAQITVVMDAGDGLSRPVELTVDRLGNLYVANVGSPNVLRLSQDGRVSVFVAGQGTLNEIIGGLAFGPQGDLFIASGTRIYRFDSSNSSLTLFGDITSADPTFNILEDIEFDHNGNLYAASGQNGPGLGAIVKFDPQGNASVFANGLANPRDLAVDSLGHLYVANRVGEVVNRIDLSNGSIQLFADLSQASGDPRGVKTDLDDNVYVLNFTGDIRKWDSNGLGGNIVLRSGSNFSEALAFSPMPISTPPLVVTVSANPTTLWPPNRKLVPITVSGTITDRGGSGVNVSSAAYAVMDEYGQIQPRGNITLGADGRYTFTVALEASRRGNDQDGRHYTIAVSAKDNAGNLGVSSTIVIVPHDQGQ